MKPSYEKNDEPIVLSKPLMDLLFKQGKNFRDVLALYCFYYYTAKWQGTNQPRATNQYVANGLEWHIDTVKKYKKKLDSLGLIKQKTYRDKNNKIVGYYILVNFIWSHEKVLEILQNQDPSQKVKISTTGDESQRVKKTTGGKFPPQMLEVHNSKNALSSGNIKEKNKKDKSNTYRKIKKRIGIIPNNFDKFWENYPRKIDKQKAKIKFEEINTNLIKENKKLPLDEIIHSIEVQKEYLWKNIEIKFIPHPKTWLNQHRWQDTDEIIYYKPVAVKLSNIITKNSNITIPNKELYSWMIDFKRLADESNVSRKQMIKVLQWLSKNIGQPYTPIITSGKTFYYKYRKLDAAMNRVEPKPKKQEFKNRTGLSAKDQISKQFKT